MPPALMAICSRAGVSCLHGPHQSAYISSSTGTGDSITNFCKSFISSNSNITSSFLAGVGAPSGFFCCCGAAVVAAVANGSKFVG